MERKTVSSTDDPEPETDYYLNSLFKKILRIYKEVHA
jgi:hypothetical protein